MNGRHLLIGLLLFVATTAHATGTLYTDVTLDFSNIDPAWVSSLSHADYDFKAPTEPTPWIWGYHDILGGGYASTANGAYGSWSDYVSGPAVVGQCNYRGYVEAWESNNNTSQGAMTGEECAPEPQYPQCTIHTTVFSTDNAYEYGPQFGYAYPWKYTVHCGSTVTISAYPANGYEFDHWEGEAYSTSSSPITVRVFYNDTEERVYFRPIPPPPPAPLSYNLQISVSVDGSITTQRTESYPAGATVTASPITPTGYRFTGWSGVVNSSQETISFQMPAHDTSLTANFTYEGNGGGGPGDDGGIGNEDLPCFPGIDPNCYYSPILINLENGGYRLTGRNAPVLFDMAGNGHPRPMGWTEAGADEVFVWLDRDHNGKVTSGAELFGNFTPLQNGQLARNGFEALRESDTNGDDVIDERDPIWSQLMLWRDLNHNGISEQNEIQPIAGSAVTAIDLHDHWSGRRDTSGNLFKYESLVSIRNGSGNGVHKQPIYDIFFVPLPYVP